MLDILLVEFNVLFQLPHFKAHCQPTGVKHWLQVFDKYVEQGLAYVHAGVEIASATDLDTEIDEAIIGVAITDPELLAADGAATQPGQRKNTGFIQKLLDCDVLIVAGQAKSHCVAFTIADLLDEIQAVDPQLAGKVYLLEDCTSPVVIPDVIDYTDAADAAFQRFADAGMHRVRSTDPVSRWPGM